MEDFVFCLRRNVFQRPLNHLYDCRRPPEGLPSNAAGLKFLFSEQTRASNLWKRAIKWHHIIFIVHTYFDFREKHIIANSYKIYIQSNLNYTIVALGAINIHRTIRKPIKNSQPINYYPTCLLSVWQLLSIQINHIGVCHFWWYWWGRWGWDGQGRV